jgi:pyrroloquinoline quinone (PQQ) biosynthesis protein C
VLSNVASSQETSKEKIGQEHWLRAERATGIQREFITEHVLPIEEQADHGRSVQQKNKAMLQAESRIESIDS